MREELEELEAELSLLQGYVTQRYTDDVEALQDSDDELLEHEVERAVTDVLPQHIATVADSMEDVWNTFSYGLLGEWGKERRNQRELELRSPRDIDADSYRELVQEYVSTTVEHLRTTVSALYNRSPQVDDEAPAVERPYSDRDVRELERLTETFEEVLDTVSAYEPDVNELVGTTVTAEVEDTYGPVTGLTADPAAEQDASQADYQ